MTISFGLSEEFYDAFFFDNDNDDPFCTTPDEGMIMYMDGFRSSLSAGDNNPCLNLYFITWTLNTRAKFLWAMLGIVALGVVTEGVSKLRSTVSKHAKGALKRWSIALLHGLQALVGYILMLATMTFSVELLASVILGLGLGFAIFYADDDLHVTTNPCCNFIQEEFYERASTLRRQHLADQEAAKQQDEPLLLLASGLGAGGQAAGVGDEALGEAAATPNAV